MKITIDTKNLKKLKADAGKVFLEPEAEEVLLTILKLEKQVTETKDYIKAKLQEEAEKINPEFEALKGTNTVVRYSSYGYKYRVDESRIKELDKEFYNKKISYYANSDAIEEYADQHKGRLPLGVDENQERNKKVSFYAKKGVLDNE